MGGLQGAARPGPIIPFAVPNADKQETCLKQTSPACCVANRCFRVPPPGNVQYSGLAPGLIGSGRSTWAIPQGTADRDVTASVFLIQMGRRGHYRERLPGSL